MYINIERENSVSFCFFCSTLLLEWKVSTNRTIQIGMSFYTRLPNSDTISSFFIVFFLFLVVVVHVDHDDVIPSFVVISSFNRFIYNCTKGKHNLSKAVCFLFVCTFISFYSIFLLYNYDFRRFPCSFIHGFYLKKLDTIQFVHKLFFF